MKFKSALAAVALAGAMPAGAQDVILPPDYPETYAQDRAEIEDLMARYLMAIDYFDWDSYVGTFTEDGELEFASGAYRGREEIRNAVTSFSERIGQFYANEDGSPATLRHVILQSSIRVEGDRAWARTTWVEMADDGPGDSLKMGTFGLYEDEFARVDGKWLIKRRNVLNDFIDGRNSGPNNPVRDMDAAAEAHRAAQ